MIPTAGIGAWAAIPGPADTRRRMLAQVVPGLLVGVGSAVTLIGLSSVAGWLEHGLWTALPSALGLDGSSGPWIMSILVLTGIAVGLVVRFAPGHAGPDPATTGLAAPPLPVTALPGLALALVLTLAGGVSLGPENPIIAINVGLAVALGARSMPMLGVPTWAGLAVSGTIGAMFGTPVAAALLLGETPGERGVPLWDRLFGPLVAAAAGSLTMLLFGIDSFGLAVAPYDAPVARDLVSGSVVAVVAALVGLVAVRAFPVVHAALTHTASPMVSLVIGALILGVLGVIGGPISLFKGLDEMKGLAASASTYAPLALAGLAVLKLAAVVVASGSGFRGGRIFPSVFAAVALGLAANAAFPQVPEAVALAGALVGMLVAVTRSGWIAIFLATLMVGSPAVLPLACVLLLPAWLVVTGQPEMIVEPSPDGGEGTREKRRD